MWSTGEGNGKSLQYGVVLEFTRNSMKRQKKKLIPEDEPPREEGVQYATGEELRNSSRRNVEAEPKQK